MGKYDFKMGDSSVGFEILTFDPSHTITQYLDWLNMDDCQFDFYDESPWAVREDFSVLLSLEESRQSLLSDFFSCGSLTIVSERVRQVIEEVNSNVEFIPVTILCGETDEFRFYALHIMSICDVVDRDASSFAGLKYGMVAGITSLKLKLAPIEDIVLLKDTFTPITIISDRLRDALRTNNLTGMDFVPLEEYKEDTLGIA